jgi:hypothetical protein
LKVTKKMKCCDFSTSGLYYKNILAIVSDNRK